MLHFGVFTSILKSFDSVQKSSSIKYKQDYPCTVRIKKIKYLNGKSGRKIVVILTNERDFGWSG